MSALVALAFVGPGLAHADPTKPKRGRAHQVVPTGAEDAPGATLDAQAEAELAAMTSRSSVGLVPVVRFDGTVMVDLAGRFMDVAIAGAHGVDCHAGTSAVTVARARAQATRTARVKAPRRARTGAPPRVVRPTPVPAPAPAPSLEVM
ncbi:MAG: hypothetical protein R3B06_02340 [Kofleriaceae bacterium]